MEITIGQLADAVGSLRHISSQQLPVKAAFNIGRFINSIQPELTSFDTQRLAIIQKYTVPDGSKIDENKFSEFEIEYRELLDCRITVNGNTLTLEDLDESKLSPAQAITLLPFIDKTD